MSQIIDFSHCACELRVTRGPETLTMSTYRPTALSPVTSGSIASSSRGMTEDGKIYLYANLLFMIYYMIVLNCDLFEQIPFDNFVLTNTGEISYHQMTMYRERIRTVGISLLGGKSGVEGSYELGIDSIRAVNEEDVPHFGES